MIQKICRKILMIVGVVGLPTVLVTDLLGRGRVVSASQMRRYAHRTIFTPENTVIIFDIDGVILSRGMLKKRKKMLIGIEDIILILKGRGYRIDGATNNKQKRVEYYVRKFAIFKCFSRIKCITSRKDKKKPSSEYFQDYINRFADPEKPNLIFFDDSLDNVVAARRNGFIAIHYQDAEQAYAELQSIGIVP